MSTKTTKIEWTDKTWNPITGCTKRSGGCAHCYAEVMARRLKAMGLEKYRNGFRLTLHEDSLEEPLQWRKPYNIFACSMSDIFHEEVPLFSSSNGVLGVATASNATNTPTASCSLARSSNRCQRRWGYKLSGKFWMRLEKKALNS